MAKASVDRPYRRILYSVLAVSWFSGVTFFVLSNWFQVEGEFGIQKHPFQFTALQIHGLAAFAMMVIYGYFLGTHVKNTWNMKPRRILGVILALIPLFLMITGYLLYYVAEANFRVWTAYAHFSVGFSLPLIVFLHVRQSMLLRKQRRNLKGRNR